MPISSLSRLVSCKRAARGPRSHRQLPMRRTRRSFGRDRLVLPAPLRFGTRVRPPARSGGRTLSRRSGRRRHGHPALSRQHERAGNHVRCAGRALPRGRLRASLRAAPPDVPSDPARADRRADRRIAAHRRALGAGARLVESASPRGVRVAPHQLRRLPQRAQAHDRSADVASGGPAVHADRATRPGALVGRAGRRTAPAALRSLFHRDHAALAALGQTLRHPAALSARSHSIGARAQAPLLRRHRRHHRGDDDVDSRIGRQRPHVGLPLLLAAGRLLRRRRLPPAGPVRRARAVHHVPARHRRRQSGSLARADLRRRREVESGRTHRAELGRMERRRAGAHRQRRGVPRAARHLRRARPRARPGVSRRAVQRRAVAGDTRSAVSTGATRDRARRPAGHEHLGVPIRAAGHARSRA